MALKNVYMLTYNLAQAGGWAYMLSLLWSHYAAGGPPATAWQAVWQVLTVFQWAAVAELVHSILGLVRSSVFTALVQVASRVFLVALCLACPSAAAHPAFTLMAVAWGVTEVVRYVFYADGLLGGCPYWLTWLRYSLFYVLYPLGAGSEAFIIWLCIPVLRASGLLVVSGVDLALLGFVVLVVYVPGLPFMMYHMVRQRRKALR